MKGITIGYPNTRGINMNVAWYLPAGVIETIYWLVTIVVVYRFNRDLHKPINPHMIDTIYVRSETTDWHGFVKINRH